MDTITHGIVGALAGQAFFSSARDEETPGTPGKMALAKMWTPLARTAIAACTIGSIFPDIDIFAGPLARNPLAILEWHRNVTHSLVLLPLWALLLAAVSRPLARRIGWPAPSFARLVIIYAVGLATHLFLDSVTNFGTMLWSPVRYTRVAWDWVFIVDFTLTAIALVPQLLAWSYREPSRFMVRGSILLAALSAGALAVFVLGRIAGYGFSAAYLAGIVALLMAVIFFPALKGAGFGWSAARWCRTGFAVLCVYVALAAAAHHVALGDTRNFAAAHQLGTETIAVLPLPPSVTHWAGVITTPTGTWRATFHLPGGGIERTQIYADERMNPFAVEAQKLRDVQIYLWFARFPIWNVTESGGRTIVDVSDIRFFRGEQVEDAPSAQPVRFSELKNMDSGFTFEIIFDAGGRVVAHGFKKPQR